VASTEESPRDVSPAVIYTTVAVTSGSALLFELFQTRILSFIFWNHIVYLAISIALLGFGVSGTVVSWITRKPIANLAKTIARLCACLSLSFILAVLAIAVLFPRCLRESSPESKLTFCYLVSIPPFIFAGSILALLFSYGGEPMGRLYGTDLAAASVGCALFFLLLPSLGAIPCVMLLALITGVAALVWAWRERGSARIWLGLLILTAAHFFTLGLVAPNKFDFLPENYKEMTLSLAEGAAIERTEWTTLSRIDVLTSTPRTKGILFGYHEHPPYSYKIITQDASAHTRLLGSAAIADIDEKVKSGNPLSRSAAYEGISWPTMIPYSILNRPDVAIIGTGGGIDVANALANNPHSVFAIELNPFTYQLTRNIYSRWNGGLLHDSRVTAVNDEGRSAIRRSSKEFDFIAVIAIDTFAALNSGAYVLSENYLYTVDAFRDYFNHLKHRRNAFPLSLEFISAEGDVASGGACGTGMARAGRFEDRRSGVGSRKLRLGFRDFQKWRLHHGRAWEARRPNSKDSSNSAFLAQGVPHRQAGSLRAIVLTVLERSHDGCLSTLFQWARLSLRGRN
jgi:hypothetical protein